MLRLSCLHNKTNWIHFNQHVIHKERGNLKFHDFLNNSTCIPIQEEVYSSIAIYFLLLRIRHKNLRFWHSAEYIL